MLVVHIDTSRARLPVTPGRASLIWCEGSLGEQECEFLLELSSVPPCLSSSSTRRCLLKGFRRWSRIRRVTGHSKCKSIAIDPWLPLPWRDSWLTLMKYESTFLNAWKLWSVNWKRINFDVSNPFSTFI